MTDYDNSNKGAAFPPFDKQQLILQGKLNVNGTEAPIALIKDETKTGKTIIGVYQKVGVLFQNEKEKDGQPDYTGTLDFDHLGETLRLAAWKKMGNGKAFLSLSVSEKQGSKAQQPIQDDLPNDDIPW